MKHELTHRNRTDGTLVPACICGWYSADGSHLAFERHMKAVQVARDVSYDADCTCPHIYVGSTNTGSREWNPDCPQHGTDSDWYKSPAQVERRRLQSERLRGLQLEAARRRRDAREPKDLDLTDPRVLDAVRQVRDAWIVAGRRPDIHRAAQIRLGRDWPTLAQALNRLEELTS